MPVELGEALPVGGNFGVDDFFRGELPALRAFAQTRLQSVPVARIKNVRLAKMAVRTDHGFDIDDSKLVLTHPPKRPAPQGQDNLPCAAG